MAGAAARKIKEKAASHGKVYKLAFGFSAFFYNFAAVWRFTDAPFWELFKCGFLSLVGYVCLQQLLSGLEVGNTVEYAQDVFIVNTLVCVLVPIVGPVAWNFYMLVPLYLLYFAGTKLWAYGFAPAAEVPEEERAAAAKKQAKAERQQARAQAHQRR